MDSACATTWISGAWDLRSRNSASPSTHNDVTSYLMSLSADVLLSRFYFSPPPLHLFKPFGCHATILKPEVALLKKTQPRGLTGLHVGTALPRDQSGYLIWIPSEKRITTAVHAVFDEKFSRLAVSHHESTIFLLHYHQLTTNCSMIIYLSHITLRHLSMHRLLLSSHTHIPAMKNLWNSTLRAMTKNRMMACLPFQLMKEISTLQLQCQSANILTSTNSINSTQTLYPQEE